jgi:hypothetical protein
LPQRWNYRSCFKSFNENSLKEIVENGIFAKENRAKELNG